jgi:cell division protein FtsZ
VRVTVVATGLGRPAAAARTPLAAPREREALSRGEPPMRVVRRAAPSMSDYAGFDKPTVQRQRAVGDGLRADADPEELLDIPAFLRRQAD